MDVVLDDHDRDHKNFQIKKFMIVIVEILVIVIAKNLNDRNRDRDRRNFSDRDRGCRNLDDYEYENFSHRKFVIKFSNNQKLLF